MTPREAAEHLIRAAFALGGDAQDIGLSLAFVALNDGPEALRDACRQQRATLRRQWRDRQARCLVLFARRLARMVDR